MADFGLSCALTLAAELMKAINELRDLDEDQREMQEAVASVQLVLDSADLRKAVKDDQDNLQLLEHVQRIRGVLEEAMTRVRRLARKPLVVKILRAADYSAQLHRLMRTLNRETERLTTLLSLKIHATLREVNLRTLGGMAHMSGGMREDIERTLSQSVGTATEALAQRVEAVLRVHLPSLELRSPAEREAVVRTLKEEVAEVRDRKDHAEAQLLQQIADMLAAADAAPDVPPYLCCPIKQDLMDDPVLLVASGHSFERAMIERWLATGDHRHPLTGMPLDGPYATLLVPNLALRDCIDAWRAAHGPGRALEPPQPVVSCTTGRTLAAAASLPAPLPDVSAAAACVRRGMSMSVDGGERRRAALAAPAVELRAADSVPADSRDSWHSNGSQGEGGDALSSVSSGSLVSPGRPPKQGGSKAASKRTVLAALRGQLVVGTQVLDCKMNCLVADGLEELAVRQQGLTLCNLELHVRGGLCLDAHGVQLVNVRVILLPDEEGSVPAGGVVRVRGNGARLVGCRLLSKRADEDGRGGGQLLGRPGLVVCEGGSAELVDCFVSGMPGAGVVVERSGECVMERTACCSNAGCGVLARGSGATLHVGKGCSAARNGESGFAAAQGARASVAPQCTAEANGAHGFLADGRGAVMRAGERCIATLNLCSGFAGASQGRLLVGAGSRADGNSQSGFHAEGGACVALQPGCAAERNLHGACVSGAGSVLYGVEGCDLRLSREADSSALNQGRMLPLAALPPMTSS